MDNLAIKMSTASTPQSAAYAAKKGEPASPGTSGGGLAATFSALIRNLGSNIAATPGTADPSADIAAVMNREDAAEPVQDRGLERYDDRRGEHTDDSARDASRADTQRTDRRDGGDREPTGPRDDRRDVDAAGRDDSRSGQDDGKPRRDDSSSDRSSSDRSGDGRSENSGQDAADGAADPTQRQNPENADGSAVVAATNQAAVGQKQAEQVLSGMIAALQTNQGKTEGDETAAGDAGDGKAANALDGLMNALDNVTKGAGRAAGTMNQGPHTKEGHHTQGQNQAQAQGPEQAQAMADTAPGSSAGNDAATRQAAQLSRMVGSGNKIQVEVDVSDAAGPQVSQPSSTLTAGTIGAFDEAGPSLHAEEARSGPATANPNALAAQAAQQQNGSATPQSQVQQGVQQVGGIEAKGSAQATGPGTQAAQQPQAAGGETGAPAASTPQTESSRETQRAAAPQASQHARPGAQASAVVDQVSVQISKAASAGNDRIHIQLRPENLGRVDVQMEVAQDGSITAVVTADNKDTLDLLKRDADQLAKSLQQAGLQLGAGDLSFNLRGEGGQTPDDGGRGPTVADIDLGDEPSLEELLADVSSASGRGSAGSSGRVDIRA